MIYINPHTITKKDAEIKIDIYEKGNFAFLQELGFLDILEKEKCVKFENDVFYEPLLLERLEKNGNKMIIVIGVNEEGKGKTVYKLMRAEVDFEKKKARALSYFHNRYGEDVYDIVTDFRSQVDLDESLWIFLRYIKSNSYDPDYEVLDSLADFINTKVPDEYLSKAKTVEITENKANKENESSKSGKGKNISEEKNTYTQTNEIDENKTGASKDKNNKNANNKSRFVKLFEITLFGFTISIFMLIAVFIWLLIF